MAIGAVAVQPGVPCVLLSTGHVLSSAPLPGLPIPGLVNTLLLRLGKGERKSSSPFYSEVMVRTVKHEVIFY